MPIVPFAKTRPDALLSDAVAVLPDAFSKMRPAFISGSAPDAPNVKAPLLLTVFAACTGKLRLTGS